MATDRLFTADEVLATIKAVASAEQERHEPEIDRMARIVIRRLEAHLGDPKPLKG